MAAHGTDHLGIRNLFTVTLSAFFGRNSTTVDSKNPSSTWSEAGFHRYAFDQGEWKNRFWKMPQYYRVDGQRTVQ
jgi:hypothetical protein